MDALQVRRRAWAVVALALLSVALSPPQALARQPVTFGSGWVEWGVAERWRCYVVGNVARGQIEVSGGAEKIPGTLAAGTLCTGRNAGSERLRFPVKGGSYDAGELTLQLRGSVRFWGHDYHVPGNPTPQLDTRFTNLRIVTDGTAGTLTADTAGATMGNPAPVTRKDVPLVRFDDAAATPFDGGLAWPGLTTTLTAQGAEVFGSYPAGEPFDPITISAVFGEPQTDPDPVPTPVATIAPPPVPTATPTPTPVPVAEVTPKKASTLTAKRTASLATVACPQTAVAGCRVAVPKSVAVTIAGKRYKATLSTPTRLAAGRSATVRVKLGAAAAKRLRGRSVKVKAKLTTTVAGKASSATVTVTITGRPR